MSMLKSALFLCLALALTGCFETEEEAQARLTQFNGRTLDQVIAVIGPPSVQNNTSAVWFHESTHTDYEPGIGPYGFGLGVGYGRRGWPGYGVPVTSHYKCTYTATLKAGRVVSGTYKGNSCTRFAPRPKKQPDA